MTRDGDAVIEQLLRDRHLEQISGDTANGESFLAVARQRLSSARQLVSTDPESAFTLAYDSARIACTGLLAQYGLRPTTTGGHIAVTQAVRALLGERFAFVDQMRSLRNTLEYNRNPTGADVQVSVVEEAIRYTGELIDNAEKALPLIKLWRGKR